MGFTTSYWHKEQWSRRAADTLTSYGLCWNPSLGTWDVKWPELLLVDIPSAQFLGSALVFPAVAQQRVRWLACTPIRTSLSGWRACLAGMCPLPATVP